MQTLLFDLLGVRLQVSGSATPRTRSENPNAVLPSDRKREFEKLAEENELLKKIVDTFDTEFLK